jgi:hypothetical protein
MWHDDNSFRSVAAARAVPLAGKRANDQSL